MLRRPADFDRAAQILAGPAAKPDADIADLEVLAESLTRLGEAARAQQQFDARAKFTAAIEVLTRLTTLAPGHQPAQRKIQQIQEVLRLLSANTDSLTRMIRGSGTVYPRYNDATCLTCLFCDGSRGERIMPTTLTMRTARTVTGVCLLVARGMLAEGRVADDR